MSRPVWESRWFLPSPRVGALLERVTRLGPRDRWELHDVDHYLLSPDPMANLKLRERTASLKLKVLHETREDRLELWSTEFDERLPCAPARWRSLTDLLRLEQGEPPAGVAEAVSTLEAAGVRTVTVLKDRKLHRFEDATVEVTGLDAPEGRRWATVNVEGPDPDEVVRLRSRVLDDADGARFQSFATYARSIGPL